MRHSWTLMCLALVTASSALAAQQVPNPPDAVEVRKQFTQDLDTLYSKFHALAEAIPADKYTWRPAPGVRSIGEVFMHVASEFYVWTPLSYGAKPSPVIPNTSDSAMKKFESMSTKADVLKHLKDGYTYTKATLAALPPSAIAGDKKMFGGSYTIIETSFGMAGDLHEHLGQLIAYARTNGIKPPWTK
jgi:DinB superfamily